MFCSLVVGVFFGVGLRKGWFVVLSDLLVVNILVFVRVSWFRFDGFVLGVFGIGGCVDVCVVWVIVGVGLRGVSCRISLFFLMLRMW